MLALEDRASGQLEKMREQFDLTASSFERGADAAVVALSTMESGSSGMGDFLAAVSGRTGVLPSATRGLEEAGKDFFEAFRDAWIQDDKMGESFTSSVRDGVTEAELEAMSLRERKEFLGGEEEKTEKGADLSGLKDALSPLAKLWGFFKKFMLLGMIFETLSGVFTPFLEIMQDFFFTVFAPLEDVLLRLAIKLSPVFDALAAGLIQLLDKYFPSIVKFMEEDFLPTALMIIDKFIIPAIEWLAEFGAEILKWIISAAKGKKGIMAMVAVIGAALAPVIYVVVSALLAAAAAAWGFTAALLANPLTWVVIGIAAVIGILYLWAGSWENLWKKTKAVWKKIKPYLISAWEAIKQAALHVWKVFKRDVIPILKQVGKVFVALGKALWAWWKNVTWPILKAFWGIIKVLAKVLWSWWKDVVWPVLKGLGKLVVALGIKLYGVWKDYIQPFAIKALKWIEKVINKFAEFLDDPSKIMKQAKEWIGGLWDTIKKKFTELLDWLYESAKKLPQMIKKGIKAGASSAWEGAKNLAGGIRDYFTSSDAKLGPLSDITASGEALPAAFAAGMEKKVSVVGEASLKLAKEVQGGVKRASRLPTVEIEAAKEDYKPVVDVVRDFAYMVKTMYEQYSVDEGERRVRREISALSGFEV